MERRHWEVCLLWELWGALRSGDVWVEGSRRYADPQKYLILEDRWPYLREEVRLQTGASSEGVEHLAERKRELGRVLGRLRETSHRAATAAVRWFAQDHDPLKAGDWTGYALLFGPLLSGELDQFTDQIAGPLSLLGLQERRRFCAAMLIRCRVLGHGASFGGALIEAARTVRSKIL